MLALLVAAAILIQAPGIGQDARLAWVPNPRSSYGGWVSDPAHHLSPATVARLDSTIAALDRATTTEIAVVVIDSLDGLEPADAALRIHRAWGVGKRARDNGIVVLWSPALRKTYVSVGYGLEGVLPDAKVGRIQDEYMIPAFKRGEFDLGLVATVQALADVARGEKYVGPNRLRIDRDEPGFFSRIPRGAWFTLAAMSPVLLVFSAAGILALVGKVKRYRPRKCPNGHGVMTLLGERDEDARLEGAEKLEEGLGSIDYDVWVCPVCDTKITVPHPRESKYGLCPKCSRMTLRDHTLTMMSPTYSETGKGVRTRECRNCKFKEETEVILPKRELQTASGSGRGGSSGGGGSSSGGGSSFGGGSSGGGGAGRSY